MGDKSAVPVDSSGLLVLGRVSGLYGVKGWVKLYSYTDPMENIFSYSDCYIKINDSWQQIKLDQSKRHGKGLIAHIEGCDDRDLAAVYVGADIAVPDENLPKLEEGDYYWHQLEGLLVVTIDGLLLGQVDHLLDTGANDVLVVKPTADSVNQDSHLIPYIAKRYVKSVALGEGKMIVDWHPDD